MKAGCRLVAGILFSGAAVAAEPGYVTPRTSFGDPDLQGLWTNASLTALERPATLGKLVVSADEAAVIERAVAQRMANDGRTTPPTGTPASTQFRGYNTFWLDQGSRLGVVNGEIRTSWIVDPANGRVPYSSEGLRALRAAASLRSLDDPEARPLAERCIVGFGSTSGPPMLNVIYNNHYQIVQSPGHVAIVVEMNHDARIVRLGGTHAPRDVKVWMGDSIGHWDGDTLVVETTNFHPLQAYVASSRGRLYLGPDAKVTERFRRVGTNEILYGFTVEDARTYTQPWRGEMTLRTAEGPMYEYACHEGNRSLEGILRGARYEERQRRGAH